MPVVIDPGAARDLLGELLEEAERRHRDAIPVELPDGLGLLIDKLLQSSTGAFRQAMVGIVSHGVV